MSYKCGMCGLLSGWRLPVRSWVALCWIVGGLSGCARPAAPPALEGIELVDQDGHVVSPAFLANEVLVLNFMFTSCQTVCPRATALLATARARLPEQVRQRVRFLSVSVDPDNDDPLALKSFATSQRVDVPGWRFVRVGESALAELSERVVVFDPGAPASPTAHNTDLFLFDRGGRLVQRYRGPGIDPERLAREIATLDALGRPNARDDRAPQRASLDRFASTNSGHQP